MIFEGYMYASIAFGVFLLWVLSFVFNKKHRKSILIMSVPFIILAPLAELMHLVDWWNPRFLFDTFFHIEDAVFGFSTAGFITSNYCLLRSWMVKESKNQGDVSLWSVIVIPVIATVLFFAPFYIWGISSVVTSIFALGFLFIMGGWFYPRYIGSMIIMGIVTIVLFIPWYLYGMSVNPNWITEEWLLHKLSGVFFLGIPIEELLWYFLMGIGISGYQEIIMKKY